MAINLSEKEIDFEIQRLKELYPDNLDDDPDLITCPMVFENTRSHLKQKLNKLKDRWLFQIPVGEYSKLSEMKLKQILVFIDNPPTFLDDDNLLYINSIKKKIYNELDSSNTETIFRLFKTIKITKTKLKVTERLGELI